MAFSTASAASWIFGNSDVAGDALYSVCEAFGENGVADLKRG